MSVPDVQTKDTVKHVGTDCLVQKTQTQNKIFSSVHPPLLSACNLYRIITRSLITLYDTWIMWCNINRELIAILLEPYTIILLWCNTFLLKFIQLTFWNTINPPQILWLLRLYFQLMSRVYYVFRFHITFSLVMLGGMCQDDPLYFGLCIIGRHFSFYLYILQVALWCAGTSHFPCPVTDPLPNTTTTSSNLLLDLNLNMYLNLKTVVHGKMYNVEYWQPNFAWAGLIQTK